jgi:hypothetical protein
MATPDGIHDNHTFFHSPDTSLDRRASSPPSLMEGRVDSKTLELVTTGGASRRSTARVKEETSTAVGFNY